MATRQEALDANLKAFGMETELPEFRARCQRAVETYLPYIEHPTVTDLGCGDGAAYFAFKKAGIRYYGIDINPRKLAQHPGATRQIEMYDYLSARRDNQVANIFCHHALEHTANHQQILDEIARVLEPGGTCFLTVPYGGEVYSVHFATFTDIEQLVPPGLTVLMGEIKKDYPEIKVITRKPL